jgi:ABC-type branched-subunit amino acid transport system permease subunit
MKNHKHPLGRNDKIWLTAAAFLFIGLAVIPTVLSGNTVTSLRDILLFALFAVALDFFWGRSGILSFGHATFFGLGAYGMAIATVTLGIPANARTIVGLGLGVGFAAVLAFGIGYFLIKGGVRGVYFTITTLALSLIAQQIAVGWSSVTGGDSGLIGVPALQVGGLILSDPSVQYYFACGLLLIIAVTTWAILRGRHGLVLKAIEDNEIKAETLGYATSTHLIALFTLSAVVAALAGSLYAAMTGFVAPDMIGLVLSTEVIMWVALGGRGLILGSIVGTIIVWQLQQRISSWDTTLWPMFMGLFFIAMVFLFPNGLLSLRWRNGNKAPQVLKPEEEVQQ